jgi:hypothetical protein
MTKKTKGRIALIGFDADSRREYITGERKRRDINRVMHLERHKNKEYQAKLEKRRQVHYSPISKSIEKRAR